MARVPRRGPARRGARLRLALDVGPHLRDLRRPAPAHPGRLRRAAALAKATDADPPWAVRRRGDVPEPVPGREVPDDDRPRQRRPGGPRHRRGWFELEHTAFGIDFGSGFGQRLDWLDESVSAIRTLLDGGTVTSEPGGRYAFDELRIPPLPVQAPPPDHDRRRGREEDAPDRGPVRRHVERRSGRPRPSPQGRDPARALRGGRPDRPRSSARSVARPRSGRREAEAERVLQAPLDHNRTPRSQGGGGVAS